MKTYDKKQIKKIVNGKLGEEAKSQLFSSVTNGEVDNATSKELHLELNKKINRTLPWRERIPTRMLAQIIDDAQAAPPAPAFVLTGRPLSEIVREIDYLANAKASDAVSAEAFVNGHTELLCRDEGLLDILYGNFDTPDAINRTAKLKSYLDAPFDSDKERLSDFVLRQVPELPWYELDTVMAFLRANTTCYGGDANDPEEFLQWAIDFTVNEAKRRAFLHLVIREHSKVIHAAINRQLEKVSDLCSPDEWQGLFWEVLELAWERYADSLQEPGTAKLSTRLYKLAARNAMNYTKGIKDRVAIERRNPSVFPEPESPEPAIRG